MDSGASFWDALHASRWVNPGPSATLKRPPAPPPAAPPRVTIIDTTADLDRLESAWDALFAASPAAVPPLRFNWVREWWRLYGPVYGDQGRGLRIIAIWRASTLIGLLPLYTGHRRVAGISVRRLTCITAGADEFEETSADYLGLLHAPGQEDLCVAALLEAFRTLPQLEWDELHLPNLSDNSPLKSLAAEFANPNQHANVPTPPVAFLCDLRGGFEEYLKRLSSKNRKNARTMLRDADNAGLHFQVASSAPAAAGFFEQMVDLHHKRWLSKGKTGSFSPRHADFHRSLVIDGAASGNTIIARLSHQNTPVALFYGHRAGDTFHCYQQGTDVTASCVRSPGIAASLLLMRHLADHGTRWADFQQGPNTYKERYCTDQRPLATVHVVRPSLRCFGFALAQIGQRTLRKALHLNAQSPLTPPAAH